MIACTPQNLHYSESFNFMFNVDILFFSEPEEENLSLAEDYLTCSQLKSTCVNNLLESSVVLLRLVERSAYFALFQDVYTHRVL